MEHFRKLMEKKRQAGSGSLDKAEAQARGSVLHDMVGALDDDGLKKVKGLKKVTVAAKDQTGLEEGLSTAKRIVEQGDKSNPSSNKDAGEMKDDSDEEDFDDQDEEGPNHMPTEKEASSFGAEHAEGPETDEEDEQAPEHEPKEGSPEHIAKLKAELENAKAHIAHLQKPKSFY